MLSLFYKYFPALFFLTIWLGIISFHSLLLYNLKSVSHDTWLIIITGTSAFLLTYLTFGIYNSPVSNQKINLSLLNVDTKLLVKLVLIFSSLCILGGLFIAYSISSELGDPLIYFNRPLLVRQTVVDIQQNKLDGTPILFRLGNYLFNLGVIASFFGGILFALKGKVRLFGIIPLLALLFSQLTTLGRFTFVNGLGLFIITFAIVSYFGNNEERSRRLKEIFVYSFLAISFILVLSYLIVKWRSPLADDIVDLLAELLYYYFVGGISGLDIVLEIRETKASFGQSSFRSIYNWLYRFGLFPKEQVVQVHNDFVKITPVFRINTFTYLNSLYQDFRIYGTIIVSSFWGGLTQILLNRAYKSPKILNLFLAAIVTYAAWISFFSFYFQSITKLIYWVLVVVVIDQFYGKRLTIKQ